MIISGSINCSKITKDRLHSGKNGGKFLNFTIMLKDNPDGSFQVDQYGNNGFVAESSTKQEREAGQRGQIIGNVKVLGVQSKPAPAPKNDDVPPDESPKDNCPF